MGRMDNSQTLEADLRALDRLWSQLSDLSVSPRTTMDVVTDSLADGHVSWRYVTEFLAYVFDPNAPHGLGPALLRSTLEAVPGATGFQEDTHDLSPVQVTADVPVSARRDGTTAAADAVDLVVMVPHEWVFLIECGFETPDERTQFLYQDVTHIDGRALREFASGVYHLYLHRADRPTANEPAFANWTWQSFVRDVLDPFVLEQGPRYPSRTVTQLRAFIDDIRTITGMSDPHDHTDEKVALYLDHYDAITDVADAFDRRWETFTDEWGARLAERLELEGAGTLVDADADVIRFDPGTETDDRADWHFRTSSDDWGMIFKHGWWRHTENLETVLAARADDQSDVRIGFHHRLERNRDLAVGDRTLEVYFRVMGANDQAFIDRFTDAFGAREAEITAALPSEAEVTGEPRNKLVATYDIDTGPHEDFFDAYVGALATAFINLVVENPSLISIINECYTDSIATVYGTLPAKSGQ